jgi:CheY-like chemotaxis protein
MNAPNSKTANPGKESANEGVRVDFTGVFKVDELRAAPPAPAPAAARPIPGDILIGAQELSNGNCYINMLQPRPKRQVDISRITILIVEDDLTTQYLLHMLLSRAGYQTRRAASAEEFIAAMQKAPIPDLIILDVKLKGNISGFKILAKIRAHPKIRSMPVIILSGSTEPHDLMEGVSLGADAYLSKPTKAKSLMEAVSAVLGMQN